MSELAPLHPRDNTYPDWYGASRADPLALQGVRDRFLPECTFRGRQITKLQYAVLAAAALHAGTGPDLLDEVAWWQTDDFWQYALLAAAVCIRAAASRAGVPCARYARTRASTLATRRRNEHSGTQPKRSPGGAGSQGRKAIDSSTRCPSR